MSVVQSISLPLTERRLFERCEIDLSNYKDPTLIKQGAYGSIYQVQDKRTNKIYAAKIIRCSEDKEYMKSIDREVRIMLTTYHHTIVNFIGFSRTDFKNSPNITIIMEYAQNGSLEDFLNKKPKSFDNTARQIILTGIARGMKYLHDHFIIHRDLKPGNVLIDENYYPLITDFGMSKYFDLNKSKNQSQHNGTYYYMAPETLQEQPYGRKVDVYSFSYIIYEIVTGDDPFEGKSDIVFINKIREKHRPAFKVPINNKIKELIEKCWSENPNERPTFKELFEKFSSDEEYLLDNVNKDFMSMLII